MRRRSRSVDADELHMSQLRHLSVFVDEPDPGHYFWVLHESTEDANVWVNFASSDLDFPTWVEAYDSGTVELMRLVIDERTGPRAPRWPRQTAPPVATQTAPGRTGGLCSDGG